MNKIHLLTIESLQYRKGDILLHEEKNLKNILHEEGEQFILETAFAGGTQPTNFYFGMDDRTVLDAEDQLVDLSGEPLVSNGYDRQTAPSSAFTVTFVDSVWKARSSIVIFGATGGGWGPVTSLFMATSPDSSGLLISSVPLGSSYTPGAGESLNVRMSVALNGC